MTKLAVLAALLATTAVGCNKKDSAGSGGGGGGGALVAEPPPANLTPAEKTPFEAVTFRMTDKRGTNGWPKFNAYNLSTKPVTFLGIYAYAYDKDGKQVSKTSAPLSWNGKIAPGEKDSWGLSVGMPEDKVPGSAVTYQACYFSMKFEGDAEPTADNARCPEQRAKQ